MRWQLVAAVAACCAACESRSDVDPSLFVDAPDGAEEADAMIVAQFGLSNPLPLRWVRGNCWDDMGFEYQGKCIFGLTFDDVVVVPHPGPGVPISSTGLAHERAHNKWDDHDHTQRQGVVTNPIWGFNADDDYEPGTRVGDENAALIAAGL